MARKRSKRQKENVEIVFEKGKARYLLVNGVISWGMATGILFLTILSIWQGGFSFAHWKNTLFTFSGGRTIGLFMAAGLCWGLITWPAVEKKAVKIAEKYGSKSKKNKKTVKSL